MSNYWFCHCRCETESQLEHETDLELLMLSIQMEPKESPGGMGSPNHRECAAWLGQFAARKQSG